jgi:acyl-CoA reductase-like NAD-dependent aldehyde dehydrogenase
LISGDLAMLKMEGTSWRSLRTTERRVIPEKAGGEMEAEREVEMEVEMEETFGPWKNNWPVSA